MAFENFFKRLVTTIIFGAIFFGAFFLSINLFTLILALVAIFCLVEWANLILKERLIFWLIMPIYPLSSFIFMIALNNTNRYLLLLLFISVAVFDTASYIAGSLLGKHKIWPQISPGKSWEGFLGGFTLLFLLLAFLQFWSKNYIDFLSICFVTIIISILAIAGDMFESWFKRRAGVKDAGDLLPGHGGFLDRFDAAIFVVPFFYIFKNFLVGIFI